jgi:hypothetical protein
MKLLLAFLSLLAALSQAGCGLCSDEVQAELVSPDNALKATWFIRDCGATTDFSTIVSVHRPDNGYRDAGDFVFVAKGRKQLRVAWTGPSKLTVECTGCQRKDVFRRVTLLGNVDIVQ